MGEWKRVKLGEICSKIGSGATPTGGKSAYKDIGVSLIRSQNVLDMSFAMAGLAHIDDEQARKLDGVTVCGGDVLLNITGDSVARCCIVPDHVLPARVNQHVCILRPRPDLAENRFIEYFLIAIKDRLLTLASAGATRNALTKETIQNLEVPLPPFPTQRRIAAVLGALDDKIEVDRKICENLEAQAQALFKAWFVDDGSRIQATKQMQEVFDVTIGRTPPRKEFEWFSESKEDNVTWASIADMGSCGMFLADSSEYLTPAAVQRFKIVMIPRGTVLLSFKLTVGRVAIADVDMVSNEAIAHLRTDNAAMREYLYCYLKQYDFDTLGSTSSIATAVNSTTIKEMPFRVPTDAALVDFHNVAKPIFDLIRSKSQESRALAAMRDALLPKLMSGELAVEKVEG